MGGVGSTILKVACLEGDELQLETPPQTQTITKQPLPPTPPAPLPPDQLTVVLDLDECLIHYCDEVGCRSAGCLIQGAVPQHVESFEIPTQTTPAYVMKRPGLDKFLDSICSRYRVIVFTAGQGDLPREIIHRLDPRGQRFTGVFYRDSCTPLTSGGYTKDLSLLPVDMKRVVLVDNNMVNFLPNPHNGIPIPSFHGDPHDDQLWRVWVLLTDHLEHLGDVRPQLEEFFGVGATLAKYSVG